MKIRSLGFGGEVYRRLGATPQTTPAGEMLTSLQSGVLDAAEFVGPGTDIALGLYRVAPFYYGPGFNKPNGTGECLVSLKAWKAARFRDQGDRRACLRGRGEFRAVGDGAAQRRGAGRADDAQQRAAAHVSCRSGRRGAARGGRRCWPNSPRAASSRDASTIPTWRFRERTAPWSRISIKAVLDAREG